jgi:hypothetical protein
VSARKEEEAAGRLRESSGEAQQTLKEKEVFVFALNAAPILRPPKSSTSASTL